MTHFLPLAHANVGLSSTLKPVVVAIGGSDSAGLAGVQADNQVLHSLVCHPANVITAVTAQNNRQVYASTPVALQDFQRQWQAVRALQPKAIKLGLIATEQQMRSLVEWLQDFTANVVWDPIAVASSGTDLAESISQDTIQSLLTVCSVVTPNVPELSGLTGLAIECAADIETAAAQLLGQGAKAVYVKGGHFSQVQGYIQDYYVDQEQQFWLSSPVQQQRNQRGTGCMLASTFAAAMAQHYDQADAAVIAKMAINSAYQHSYALGKPEDLYGRPHLLDALPTQDCVPLFSRSAAIQALLDTPRSPRCDATPLGLYPVVDSVEWIQRLVDLGVSTLQLRIKNLTGEALAQAIQAAVTLAQKAKVRLFINDHWQLAIQYGAYGVHLGQEDLDVANIEAIKAAGLRLGISTHAHYEMARALALKPSYIAIGPVYPTTSKIMPWQPQGLTKLQYWQAMLDYPVVAIGGINYERMPSVIATGVSGVAMISAITHSVSPEATVGRMLDLFQQV